MSKIITIPFVLVMAAAIIGGMAIHDLLRPNRVKREWELDFSAFRT